MIRRQFGNTDLMVPALGFGAGHVGSPEMSEDAAGTLLNRAVDLGMNLIDTARGYGLSEDRVGRHLSWRRRDFILSTKGGYGVEGVGDWTYRSIVEGVENALRRMRTDWIDIFHLHSCPKDVLERGEVIDALESVVREGKVRVAAYSGDNDPLEFAVASFRFGSVECSVNPFDQRGLDGAVARAHATGLGVIAKRPIGNAPWRFPQQPHGHYCEPYWHRMKAMNIDRHGIDWTEFALRFTVFSPGVHCAIVGSSRPEHLHHNVDAVSKGPLAGSIYEEARVAFRREDRDWVGQV